MQEKTKNHTVITCNAPLEGIKLTRKISLAPHNAIFTVTETFTNQLPVLRNIPIVQHATIGVPFLDSAMVVQTNATYGFNQKFVPASYLKYESKWPYVVNDSTGKTIDAGKTNYPEGFVATYVFSDTIGWITAYNPKLRLLLGYAFKTSQYPWLHIWHGVKDGKLWAKGLEFGTTGLGDTSPLEDRFVLNFHGHSNLNYIDANSSQNKSYLCFLIKFDEDIKEIKNISYTNKFLTFTYETIDKSRIQKLWME